MTMTKHRRGYHYCSRIAAKNSPKPFYPLIYSHATDYIQQVYGKAVLMPSLNAQLLCYFIQILLRLKPCSSWIWCIILIYHGYSLQKTCFLRIQTSLQWPPEFED